MIPAPTENEDVQVVQAEVVGPPPLSSLPDAPLPPIRGLMDLVRASLSAIVCATKDPFANYREGVQSRGRRAVAVASNEAGDGQAGCAKPDKATGEAANEAASEASPEKRTEHDKGKIHVKPGSKLALYMKNVKAKVVEHDKSLPVEQKVSMELLGADKTESKPEDKAEDKNKLARDQHDRLVAVTKKRLLPLKEASDKGDTGAKKKWEIAKANLVKARAKADSGDAKAKVLVAILADTGLFA